jgi:tRNA A37 threonylcarbamoyladenosine synthetase subunit TsaC/SUA5/YrdC
LLSSTLILPGEEEPLCDAAEIEQRLDKLVDVIIDAGPCSAGMTTIINLVGGGVELVRAGKGPIEVFGLSVD